jgi:Bacterial NAD-glutamate dehydrogenase
VNGGRLPNSDGWRIDHTAQVGESSLALVHFTVQADPDGQEPNRNRLRGQLAAAILSWDDWLLDVAGRTDEQIADLLSGVPEGYEDDAAPVVALADLHQLVGLRAEPDAAPELSVELGAEPGELSPSRVGRRAPAAGRQPPRADRRAGRPARPGRTHLTPPAPLGPTPREPQLGRQPAGPVVGRVGPAARRSSRSEKKAQSAGWPARSPMDLPMACAADRTISR